MEDFFPLKYFNNKISQKKLKNSQAKKYYALKNLKHSKSESDFIIKVVKEKRKIIHKYLRKKNKIINNTNSKERSGYKKENNLKKIIRKNKLELSYCIENKGKNLKLFGNKRYNKKPPNLFVEDIKNNIPSEKMGLIPMPTSKDNITDYYKEPEFIYTMQRNLSMTRRFQYKKKEELLKAQKDFYNKNNNFYNTVQLWWKKIPQIIKIQKVFKGYSIRKKLEPIFQLYKFMQYFEKFLININLKRTFMDIFTYSILKGRKKISGKYISKKRTIMSKDIINKIIMVQNNFRCYLAKTKRNFLYRKKRDIIINKISFVTKKIYADQNKINNNIIMIQNNIKNFIKQKKYIDKNLDHKNKGIYYFEKIYLSSKIQKVIKFVELMRHSLQLLVFKKKILYKNPNEYDIDDLYKVRYIQKKYLDHYYNNIKHISLHNLKKISNANNIKNSSYITKDKIKNVIKKLLLAQRMIKWFNIKKKSIKNHINKKHININYLVTKESFILNNCITKISRLQNIYKNQYKKNKDNIIDYEEYSLEDSSYDEYTDKDNKTLRQLAYRNKIPKKRIQGLYVSKIRKIINKEGDININNNNKIIHQEGILITKTRYYNNENQIKKIQNLIKRKKLPDNLLQRPLTNNYNFYTNQSDSYDEDILYSTKPNNYNFLSKATKYNIDNKVKKIQNNFLKHYSNINKNKNIYKKEKIRMCLISKYLKKNENIKQINIKFLLLISLFIKKNIQQYGFYLLKHDLKNFEYPFCLNTINRVLKYLNSNDYKGNTIKSLFNKILKNLDNSNAIKKDFVLLLNKEQENQLREINLYEIKNNDCLDYIYGFSAFDKNLKNEKFLNVRLNNTKFYNSNIFTITKFIDNEFDNFVKGKYCYKCYLDLNACKCSKEEFTDESLDIGINDDYNPKNSIKFFEYNKNKDGTIISRKPKTKENEDIITNNKLIKSNIKKNDLISNENKLKNVLLNSRKNFEALKVKNQKEKLKENILLRDDLENNEMFT